MLYEDYYKFVKLYYQIQEIAYKIGTKYTDKKLQDWYNHLKQNGREAEIPNYNGRFYPTDFEFYGDCFTFYIEDNLSMLDREFITVPLNEFTEFCTTE
jgi:hypothetical protein